jgi:hypothetical protein
MTLRFNPTATVDYSLALFERHKRMLRRLNRDQRLGDFALGAFTAALFAFIVSHAGR